MVKDDLSYVHVFYSKGDESARRILSALRMLNIRISEEEVEDAPCTTQLILLTSTPEENFGIFSKASFAFSELSYVVVVYSDAVPIPKSNNCLLASAEEFILHGQDEESLLKKLLACKGIQLCRKTALEPYEGTLDYIFVSYAHRDSYNVLPIIRDLQDAGFRVWYDAGIEIGSEWDSYIFDHLEKCRTFLCFQSSRFRASPYCGRELDTALRTKEGSIVVVSVDESQTVDEIPADLHSLQGVFRCDFDSDDQFLERLIKSAELEPCRDTLKLDDCGRTLSKYIGGSKSPRIPSTIEEIGYRAIAAPNSRTIVVPNGVMVIGPQAFIGCGLIENVILPDSVHTISREAFLGCSSLREIEIPPQVTEIAEGTFAGCIALRKVQFRGNRVSDIKGGAFEDCVTLTSIELPSSVIRIWHHAFKGCSSLDLFIPASVEAIEHGSAFSDCRTIAIDRRNPVYSIKDRYLMSADGTQLFAVGLTGDERNLCIPEGVTIISEMNLVTELASVPDESHSSEMFNHLGVFRNCTNLEVVHLPESLEVIGSHTFEDCISLKEINIPANLTIIEESAFRGCTSLVEAHLPTNLSELGANAFSGCESLKEVSLGNQIKHIPEYAFYECRSLHFIRLPDNLTSISTRAFAECGNLPFIEFPNSLKVIGHAAFSGCLSLMQLCLPESLERIESGAFSYCRQIEGVTLPLGISEICDDAFRSCDLLARVILPESVEVIGKGAFSGCLSLESLALPSSVREIGSYAFNLCDSLQYIAIPNSLESIGRYALPSGITVDIDINGLRRRFCNIEMSGVFSGDEYLRRLINHNE